MKLHEIMNSKYDWGDGLEDHEKFKDNYEVEFETDGGDQVVVVMSLWKGMWDVEFSRGGSHSVTGEGDAIKIYSTFTDIIHALVKLRNPEFITFSGNGQSRLKFLSRWIKKIEAFGYRNASDDDDFEQYGPDVAKHMNHKVGSKKFLLVRK